MPQIKILSWKEVEDFLIYSGCEFKRQKGSHRIYKKNGIVKTIALPAHKEISRGVLLNLLRTINSNKDELEEFFK